jgi:twinkle protein
MHHDDDTSVFVAKEPCPECGSRDNLGRYSDGHAFCFGCDYYEPPTDGYHPPDNTRTRRMDDIEPRGEFAPLKARKISEETCRLFDYRQGRYTSQKLGLDNVKAHLAHYRGQDGALKAIHVRTAGKEFPWIGSNKGVQLFGQHVWRDRGKMLVITEGEIDAMSVSEAQGNKWPVVSIPNGVNAAARAIRDNITWIEGFDEVIFMFDMDEHGQDGAKECALLLTPGKAKIASLPLKDANEMWLKGRGKELIDAIWAAKVYRPEGMKSLADVLEDALKPIQRGLSWVFDELTAMTYGRRYGEAVALGAGTGVGKTDFITQQVEYDVNTLGIKVGLFFFEQQPRETALRLAGKFRKKRFHVPDAGWTTEELREALTTLSEDDRVMMFDHFGSADWEQVEKYIRYMAISLGIRVFYIDHLTALAAHEQNEKEGLERIMAAIGGLVKELDIWILFVSHLTTPEGKPHEEGGRVTIRQFKGSRAIGYWSHFMFGLERDQQADDEETRQTTTFRILKDRYTGQSTGEVFYLGYDKQSGTLFTKELEEDCPFGPEDQADPMDDEIPF